MIEGLTHTTVLFWKGHTVHYVRELTTVAGGDRLATVVFDRMTHVVKLRDLSVLAVGL